MNESYSVNSLGTICTIVSGDCSLSDAMIDLFNKSLTEMDEAASRFRDDSELSVIFDGSARNSVQVSPILFDAILAALKGAALTKGYLDPTVGASIAALGYDRDFNEVRSEPLGMRPLKAILPVGYRGIKVNYVDSTISVLEGVKLDLGATGKAFLADRIRREIEQRFQTQVLVNLGGDISASILHNDMNWPILVTDDMSLNIHTSGRIVKLWGGGLATSSILRRTWNYAGVTRHHILDPFSGESSKSPANAVTVIAGSALDANIASTGTIAMGQNGIKWLRGLGLPALVRLARGEDFKFGEWDYYEKPERSEVSVGSNFD